MHLVPPLVSCVVLPVLAAGCMLSTPVLHRPGEAPGPSPDEPLKVHLWSGDLLVLGSWSETASGVTGRGTLYGPDRTPRRTGQFVVPRDSITLLETTRYSTTSHNASIGLMGVWSVLWGALTIECLANPKSCFGSCPTFYAPDSTGREVIQAEGFSGSIARALEARDVDALYRAHATRDRFTIVMTNEAMETHAIHTLRLLAVPGPAGGQVYRDAGDRFYPAKHTVPPTGCTAAEGDCLAAVAALDTLERHSTADSTDLGAREVIDLEFARVPAHAGVVIAARQSLVSTFLFYQTIAYLGTHAGNWLAALERSGPDQAQRAMGMARALGGIDVMTQDSTGAWQVDGSYDEPGPIATDVIVVPLPQRGTGPLHVRLRMARGAWRLNYVAVAVLGDPVTPIALSPEAVRGYSLPDSVAFSRLLRPDQYLVTYPGDMYRITFRLPAGLSDPALFLESQGYYYEWMRAEWLAEEDPAMAWIALSQPATALRILAPRFKQGESRMERLFWQSRYAR